MSNNTRLSSKVAVGCAYRRSCRGGAGPDSDLEFCVVLPDDAVEPRYLRDDREPDQATAVDALGKATALYAAVKFELGL